MLPHLGPEIIHVLLEKCNSTVDEPETISQPPQSPENERGPLRVPRVLFNLGYSTSFASVVQLFIRWLL
jgi:hypothetical protein